MRRPRIIPIILTLYGLGGLIPSVSCGDDGGKSQTAYVGEVPRLPVTPNDARTWITLHETMINPLPDGASLGEIIQAIKQVSRGKDGARPPLEIYIDPISLMEEEITLDSPVEFLGFGLERVSLETYLTFVDRLIHMKHRVRNGVVVLTYPPDEHPGFQTATAAEARTWLLLHEVVPLKFPKEIPLRDVLAAITLATAGKGDDGRGLAIVIYPSALKAAETTLDSVVTIDLERTPLCTSLALVLGQIGLDFYVRNDGIVRVDTEGSSYTGEDDPRMGFNNVSYMDEFSVFDGLRFSSWLESVKMEEQERSAIDAEEPAKPNGTGKPAKADGFRSSRLKGNR